MGVARTILALLIALAVAVVPVAASAVSLAKVADIVVFTKAAPSEPSEDCHHKSSDERGSKSLGDCASLSACTAKCFNFVGVVVPGMTLLPTRSAPQSVAVADAIMAKFGSPPFRPPRV